MEELTIEQKAKRYDEILARANGANLPYYKEDIMTKVREFAEYLLPEIKESEDERVRKSLIDMLKNDEKCYLKEIAWLERQGEHSVSPLFTFEDVLTIQCAMAYAKFQDRELDVALKKLHDKVYDAYHDSKNHHIESQDGLKGEQKPYGKREECYDCQMNYGGTCKGSCAMKRGEQKPIDTKDLETAISNILKCYSHIILHRSLTQDELNETDVYAVENTKKLLCFLEQKSADKVEPKFNVGDVIRQTDKPEYTYTIREIKDGCYICDTCDFSTDNPLLELVKKKEWSEEDEDAIGMAIIALEDMYDEDTPNTTYGGYNLPFNKAAERLKSLKDRVQPQNTWKPSEEQIEALLKLEEMHVLEHEKNQENAHLYMVVKSLREQLLKLKG